MIRCFINIATKNLVDAGFFIQQSGHLMEEESQEKLNTVGSANIFIVEIFRL